MYLFIATPKNDGFALAVGDRRGLVSVKIVNKPFQQSERLIEEVDKLLNKKSVRGILAITGPGDFSSLRIGLATANALAFAWKIPVVGLKIKPEDKIDRAFIEKNWPKILRLISRAAKGKFLLPEYDRAPNINQPK
jgi:hypothetical protein